MTKKCDIIKLTEEGYTPDAIASQLNCSTYAVRRFLSAEGFPQPRGIRVTLSQRVLMYVNSSATPVAYSELLAKLNTYSQSLNYALNKLDRDGEIQQSDHKKITYRTFWKSNEKSTDEKSTNESSTGEILAGTGEESPTGTDPYCEEAIYEGGEF